MTGDGMTCEDRCAQTPDFLAADLTGEAEGAFRNHLATCEVCREEVEGLLELWAHLDLLPEEVPSPALRAGFYARLEAYRAGQTDSPAPKRWLRTFGRGAAAAGLLAAGALLGLRWQPAVRPAARTESLTAAEVDQLRSQASLGLLNRSEASDRMKGLALVSEVKRPDITLLDTLMDTLERDSSVHVRLAAVDALYLLADAPGTRERLLRAMQREPAPIVQAALIDLLVGLREKRAAEALKRLAGDPQVRPEVRQRAQEGLQRLL